MEPKLPKSQDSRLNWNWESKDTEKKRGVSAEGEGGAVLRLICCRERRLHL